MTLLCLFRPLALTHLSFIYEEHNVIFNYILLSLSVTKLNKTYHGYGGSYKARKKDKKNEEFKYWKNGRILNLNLMEREEMRKYDVWKFNRKAWERKLDSELGCLN